MFWLQRQHSLTLPSVARSVDALLRLNDGSSKQIQRKRAQKRIDAAGGDRYGRTNRRARYDFEIIETSSAASC